MAVAIRWTVRARVSLALWCGLAAAFAIASAPAGATPPLPGAILTTDSLCAAANLNIYDAKTDVYLNGGPERPNAAGLLANTSYYVQVTAPDGTLLGTSGAVKPVATDVTGKFVKCYRLYDLVTQDGGPGYADTPNPGGEYKVWVSTSAAFDNNSTKTDNFKVRSGSTPPQDIGTIAIRKFYDANTNGVWDAGEPELPSAGLAPYGGSGWKVDLLGFPSQLTAATYAGLAAANYVAEEFRPIETNWIATSPTPVASSPVYLNQTTVALTDVAGSATVSFGNVCLGAGGGLTLGFWSNKNGQAAMTAANMTNALAMLTGLNLRNPDGSNFDPPTYAKFQSWLLNGNAVNMAYMLSVQLAAMELNVYTGKVSPSALVYAAGSGLAGFTNDAGFISVAALMNEANLSLGNNNLTWAGMPARNFQEYLKSALDKANNNLTFVQATPCSYTFAP